VLDGVVAQPGLGPEIAFRAYRWSGGTTSIRVAAGPAAPHAGPRAPRRKGLVRAADGGRPASIVLPPRGRAAQAAAGLGPGGAPGHEQPRRAGRRGAGPGAPRPPGGVPYIQLIVDSDPDLFVRTQAVLALGFSGSPAAAEELARLYGEVKESEEIRTYAADAGRVDRGGAELVGPALSAFSDRRQSSRPPRRCRSGPGRPGVGADLLALLHLAVEARELLARRGCRRSRAPARPACARTGPGRSPR